MLTRFKIFLHLALLIVTAITVFYFTPIGLNVAESKTTPKCGLGLGDCGSGTIVWCCTTSNVTCGGTCNCGCPNQ